MGAGAGRERGGGERGEGALGGAGGEQEVGQGGRQGAAALGDGGGVLAVERAGEAGAGLAVDGGLVEQGGDEKREGEVDREPREPHRVEGGDADQDDLGVGLGAVMADQLDAGLGDLALGGDLAALHAQALAGIGQAQRAGNVAEAGGGDAGDLGRHVGADAHHAPGVGVHQAEGLVGHGGAGAEQQGVLELQQRRLDALVAVGGEGTHQRLDRRRLGLGVGRQQVAQPGGQQSGVGRRIVGHGGSRRGGGL